MERNARAGRQLKLLPAPAGLVIEHVPIFFSKPNEIKCTRFMPLPPLPPDLQNKTTKAAYGRC